MEKQTITVPTAPLAAIWQFTAEKDFRKYLMGVLFATQAGRLHLVATCGTALGHYETETKTKDSMFVVDRGCIGSALKFAKKTKAKSITLVRDGDANEVLIDVFGNFFRAEIISDTFPDWRRVFPSKPSGVGAVFDHRLLARFARAAEALGKSAEVASLSVQIALNGLGPGLVRLQDVPQFRGVILPYKSGVFTGNDATDSTGRVEQSYLD